MILRHRRIYIINNSMTTEENSKGAGRKQKGYFQRALNTCTLRKAFPYAGIYCVYGLSSTQTPGIIEYIGVTARSLNIRRNDHLSKASLEGTPKEKWVFELLKNGHDIVLVVLEDGIECVDEAYQKEQHYIREYRKNYPLKNVTDGGLGTWGWVPSLETKRKQSLSHQNKVLTDEHKSKISASLRNRRERAKDNKTES